MFWRNILSPSSGLKSKPSKKPAWSSQQAEQATCRKTWDYIATGGKVSANPSVSTVSEHMSDQQGEYTIISQKTELFIDTAVRTSNPT
jgi:hypothetical protein